MNRYFKVGIGFSGIAALYFLTCAPTKRSFFDESFHKWFNRYLDTSAQSSGYKTELGASTGAGYTRSKNIQAYVVTGRSLETVCSEQYIATVSISFVGGQEMQTPPEQDKVEP